MFFGISNTTSKKPTTVGRKKTKKKVATKKIAKNVKFSQYAQDIKLGAILIKDKKVTNMRMSSMAKMIKAWNSEGRPSSLEDFIKKNAKKLLKTSPATKKTITPKKKIKKTVVKKTFKEVEEDLPF